MTATVIYRSGAMSGSTPNNTGALTIKNLITTTELAPAATGTASQTTDTTVYLDTNANRELMRAITDFTFPSDPGAAGIITATPAAMQIVNIDHFRYVRFTGTELPTGGIILPLDDLVSEFTTTPTPTDL